MKSLIKAARVYHAELPKAEELEYRLSEMAFRDIKETEYRTFGFVPAPGHSEGALITTLPRGYAFAFRLDEKIVPAASVKAELDKKVAALDYQPGRKEIRELRDQILDELVQRALHRTTIVPVFYDPESSYLIVCTANSNTADRLMSSLIHCVGSVKTTTIHVSELKQGLTSRLRDQVFTGANMFGNFTLGGGYWLKQDGEKVTIESSDDEEDNGALREALEKNLQVEAVRISHGIVEFKLTSDFVFRSIRFVDPEEAVEEETAADQWRCEASLQLLSVVSAVSELCDLVGYKPEPAEE